MIACPVCLTEVQPRPRSRSHTHIWLSSSWFSCDCGRLAHNYISDYWQFTSQLGAMEFMDLKNGMLRYVNGLDVRSVPKSEQATFVQRFMDRVLIQEVLES